MMRGLLIAISFEPMIFLFLSHQICLIQIVFLIKVNDHSVRKKKIFPASSEF